MTDRPLVGFRLSAQQKALWNAKQAGWSSVTGCVVRLHGNLEPERLRDACVGVPQNHEIFRTTFQRAPGMRLPYQVIHDELPAGWKMSENTGSEPGPEAFDFNLETGPVLQFHLRRAGPELYALTIAAPSLCADAIALQNVVRDVFRAYCREGHVEIPEERLQYVDFSEWQHETPPPEDESAHAAKDYWDKLDFSALPPPTLPLENRVAQPSPGRLEVLERQIESKSAAQLAEAARASGVPIADLLLSAWCGLLWILTRQPEIGMVRIGEGRNQEQLKHATGVFAKPLPLRVRITGDSAFSDVVRQVHAAVSESDRWQDYIAPEDVASASRVGFEFVQRIETLTAGQVSFSVAALSTQLYPFKIRLACEWGEREGIARFEYARELLALAEAERIADYFVRLLGEIAGNPRRLVSEIDLLSPQERRQILEGFNQTREDLGPPACFHQLFEQQAERVPDRAALFFEDHRLTYRELNAAANRLAHYLRAQGIKANSRVGLFVTRSADMIVGLMGILKAGGAYVPLHPDSPRARLGLHLAAADAEVLVTSESMLDRLPDFDGHVFCMDRDLPRLARQPDTNPPHTADPGDLIYVIFTSGSTGAPKGVATRHENVVNYTRSISRQLKLSEPSNAGGLAFANVSPLSVDLGNTGIFAALASGGTLHIIGDHRLTDGQSYGEYSSAEHIDVLKITPSHLRALLASGDPGKVLPRKHLVVGGESLTWEMVEQVKQAAGCELLHHYGPTETTIGSLTLPVLANERYAAYSAVAPIGRPIANTIVYVLDERLAPVPVGVPGELYIGGAGVARGYLSQPELTASQFVADPIHPDSGLHFYRTGDRARWLPGGVVEFLGRQDDQVKIRGFRVELGEVEAALLSHPAVEQAAAFVEKNPAGDHTLIACVIAPGKPPVGELREFLRQRLPDPMVPSNIIFVDALPRTASGKTDRHALAASVKAAGRSNAAALKGGSKAEEKMLGIWREVLGRAEIGIDDNFFELGGHSLLATLVISRVRAEFQAPVPLRSIFEAPTAAGLLNLVEQSLLDTEEQDELGRLLSEVENLSDDEARILMEGRS